MTVFQESQTETRRLLTTIVSMILFTVSVLFANVAPPQSSPDKPATEVAEQKKDGEAEAEGEAKEDKKGKEDEKAEPEEKAGDKESEKDDELARLKANQPLDPELYVIRPSDKIEVKIFGEDDLSGEKTVDDAGVVSLDLVGRLRVAGMTVKEAEALVRQKYEEDYLFNPDVSLNVIEKAKRRFVILGQVRSPGFYEVPRSIRLDILQAIALAGGYTRIAGRVTIKRTTSRGEEILRYRLSRLRKKPKSEIPIVAEDDTVIVGESYF